MSTLQKTLMSKRGNPRRNSRSSTAVFNVSKAHNVRASTSGA